MRPDLELLKNAIDIHVHSSPDLYRRISDHTNYQMASRSLTDCVRQIEEVLAAVKPGTGDASKNG